MATVSGLTADRMLAIEAASVVDGSVVGDNLILEKHDGSTINAGNVRGPQGPATVIELDGSVDLNTIKNTGYYTQSSNAEAASGTNYPTPRAGLLEVVSNADQSVVWQIYIQHNGQTNANYVWNRGLFGGVWSAWKTISSDDVTHPFGSRVGGGTQTIANTTITKVTLLTGDQGVRGGVTWDAVNSRFTAPKAGIYTLHGRVAWTVNATGLRLIYLRINGVVVAQIANNASVGSGQALTVPQALAAGDLFDMACYQSSGGNLNLINNAGNCGLSMVYEGA